MLLRLQRLEADKIVRASLSPVQARNAVRLQSSALIMIMLTIPRISKEI